MMELNNMTERHGTKKKTCVHHHTTSIKSNKGKPAKPPSTLYIVFISDCYNIDDNHQSCLINTGRGFLHYYFLNSTIYNNTTSIIPLKLFYIISSNFKIEIIIFWLNISSVAMNVELVRIIIITITVRCNSHRHNHNDHNSLTQDQRIESKVS